VVGNVSVLNSLRRSRLAFTAVRIRVRSLIAQPPVPAVSCNNLRYLDHDKLQPPTESGPILHDAQLFSHSTSVEMAVVSPITRPTSGQDHESQSF
jgi:hypothetical protein